MFKPIKTITMAAAASGLAFSVPASAAAPAQGTTSNYSAPAAQVLGDMTYDHRKRYRHRHDGYRGYRDDRRGYYGDPVRADTRVWRGRDGRYYCRKDNGTTGLLIGGGVGALIGHEVAGRGDRTLGAILGGAAGALLGRTIDRSSSRCR